MSMVTDTLSPLLSDAMMQETEQNLSVSCLNCLHLDFADNYQIQDPGSGLFANPRNILMTGEVFVCLLCWLYKPLIIVHILSARTVHLPILENGI